EELIAHYHEVSGRPVDDIGYYVVLARYKMAAVRQVAGLLARTIVCHVHEDQVIQRGQRIGLIKLGSTTELYIPHELAPKVQVKEGQRTTGGVTVIAQITPKEGAAIIARPEDTPAQSDEDESQA
ncbi:MAG: phosphatidylserine decarboxylase, partial [Phycisphaeraceae bacterium]